MIPLLLEVAAKIVFRIKASTLAIWPRRKSHTIICKAIK